MKKKITSLLAIVVVGLTVGCETTGLSSHERGNVTYPNYIMALQPSAAGTTKAPKTPLRLAVAQIGEPVPQQCLLRRLESNSIVIASIVGLPAPGETPDQLHEQITRTIDQPAPNNFGTNVQALCRVAQSVGADYLFLFGGNIQSWEDSNPLRFLDITLVGTMIIPSTSVNTEGKAAGVLIETATGNPVLFANTEGKRSRTTASAASRGKLNTIRAELRDELADKLANDLLRQIAARNAR